MSVTIVRYVDKISRCCWTLRGALLIMLYFLAAALMFTSITTIQHQLILQQTTLLEVFLAKLALLCGDYLFSSFLILQNQPPKPFQHSGGLNCNYIFPFIELTEPTTRTLFNIVRDSAAPLQHSGGKQYMPSMPLLICCAPKARPGFNDQTYSTSGQRFIFPVRLVTLGMC